MTMTDENSTSGTDLAPPSRQALAAEQRSMPGKVTGRLRTAIMEMVWSGARRAEAADKAGMTDHSVRAALRKPHVLAFLRSEMDVLRESSRPRNFFRLGELAEQNDNRNAAVSAIKVMEQLAEETPVGRMGQRAITPGIVIVIGPMLTKPVGEDRLIEINPTGDEAGG